MTVNLGKLKLNIPVYVGRARSFMLCAVAVLCALTLAAGAVCLALELQFKRYVVEAGQSITAADITGEGSAAFGDDFDPDCVNHAGVYYVTVYTDTGIIDVRLRVKDTKAPEVTLREVYFGVGAQPPDPLDFIDTVFEPDGLTGEYLCEMPDLTRIGSHKMQVRYSDASGNKTPVYEVTMIQIYDRTPPTVTVPEVITAYVDEPVDYAQYITVTDDCVGELTYAVDGSAVDISAEGEYDVYITATDAVGNKTKVKITVEVVESIEE